ncbi:MAG: 3-oxoacyl-[acyl-carrier-protein] synthase II, partial [Kiritimatiellia bacterium]
MSVVVVGVGMVSPLASGVQRTFDRLLNGVSAVGPIRRFDASRYPVTFAAQGPTGVDPATGGSAISSPALERCWLAAALDEALADVRLEGIDPARLGVFLGSEAARPEFSKLASALLGNRKVDRLELDDHAPWAPTRWLARRVGALGATATLSTACTSSGQAVGEAMLALRRGEIDVAIAGGVDVLVHPLMLTGFARLGALSTRNDDPQAASRPFDMDRDGFVLGEGAGVLVLARGEIADSVGARLGRVVGYGCSSNAWRITDSPPDGRGALQAMSAALLDAGLTPDDVAYVNAHGTS